MHPAGERKIHFAAPQTPAGLMNGNQRRRACGIDGHARAMQIEKVRNTIRGRAQHIATHGVRVRRGGILYAAVAVVGRRDPDVNAAVGPGQRRGNLASGLQRLPGDLEQEALLGIHLDRLTWGDFEKARFELVDTLHRARRPGVALARQSRLGMPVAPSRPAIVANFTHRIDPVTQEVPVGIEIDAPARKATGSPDNGYRLIPLVLVHP